MISQLIDETLKSFPQNRQPHKMTFVIDSCYSGDAITERYNDETIEILTSTDDSKSYEKKGLYKSDKEYGISVFSYYFCEAFNSPNKSDYIDLEIVAEYIKDNQSRQ